MVVHEQSEGMRDASAKQADRAEPPRRRRLWAAAAVTVLVLGGLAAGALLAMDDDGGGADGDGAVSLSAEGTVACASSIAEGRVSQVAPEGDGDRVRVALDVDRSYKPAGGSETRLSFTTSEPDAETYYKVGVRMLVLVSSQEGEAPTTYRAGDPAPSEADGTSAEANDRLDWGRAWVEKALPGAQGLKCSGRG
ncbi:hypothetical protein [Streptomyces sp. NBC_01538]|uniref:hypothetical protein n=1 Tax=Streptomyces sp. NBC_01538 TaxID=2903897 RepID=UPI0038682905